MNKNYLRIYLGDLIEPDPDYTDEPILPRKKTPEESSPRPCKRHVPWRRGLPVCIRTGAVCF